MTTPIPSVDIAIVGAGPAGLGLAALLERHGYRYIVFERSGEYTPPRGGSLDLHPATGQRAIQEAGLQEEFDKYARKEATLHKVSNHKLESLLAWGEGRDAPEIARGALREVLMTGVHPTRIQYGKSLHKAQRNEQGDIVLYFEDGTEASGFKLVVGADGVHSKVRPLITTTAVPIFLNQFYLSFKMYPGSDAFQENWDKVKSGPMVVLGPNSNIWNMEQGDGTVQVDFGLSGIEACREADQLDLGDLQAVKAFLLQEKYFGQYDSSIIDLITKLEAFPDDRVHRWLLRIMPPELLDWEAQKDVTLIGDSAHATTPFVGEGVNRAMHDTIMLVDQLQKHGITSEAIEAYEKQMKPLAIDLVTRSWKSGATFFNEDAGASFLKVMTSRRTRAIGAGDDKFEITRN